MSIPMLIDTARLSEVRTLQGTRYDLTRLVQLCEGLNACYQVGAYHAVIMLTRAILDHIPPLFGCKSYKEERAISLTNIYIARYARWSHFRTLHR